MNDDGTLVELTELEEGVDVEVKKAGGKDGQGELPKSLAATARDKRRLPPDEMSALILALCAEHWLTIRDLELLLGRQDRALRRYLGPLLARGALRLHYPQLPNHPWQAYRATTKQADHD